MWEIRPRPMADCPNNTLPIVDAVWRRGKPRGVGGFDGLVKLAENRKCREHENCANRRRPTPTALVCCLVVLVGRIGVGHDQFAFENAFQSGQLSGHLLQSTGWAAKYDHLEADVVRQMSVQCRHHQVMVVVLHVHQLVAKLRPVVVVDQCQRARGVLRFPVPRLFRELIAQQLPNGFAASGKLLLLAITIELLEQVVF